MAAEAPTSATGRLEAVRHRIAEACRAAGRVPEDVTLLAVSKRHPDAAVRELAALGLRDFGENLVQAFVARTEAFAGSDLRWHLIGPLQTNKAKAVALARPALVHTVDREALVVALEARLTGAAPLEVLLQVNVDREPQKAGCLPEEADRLADRVAASPALRLRGLMTIPRPAEEADPRPAFAALRELSERLLGRFDLTAGPVILSMGMSDDLEAAIAEGSTLVRVGTALFGSRPG